MQESELGTFIAALHSELTVERPDVLNCVQSHVVGYLHRSHGRAVSNPSLTALVAVLAGDVASVPDTGRRADLRDKVARVATRLGVEWGAVLHLLGSVTPIERCLEQSRFGHGSQ
jgi:hypothetical protein